LFLSNWLTSLLGLATVKPMVRLTIVRTHLLVPIILVLATMGAYIYRGRLEDVFVAYVFGFMGYYMKRYGWPRIPLVIALVLGSLFENSFHLTLKLHQLERIDFWARPITMVLLGLSIVTLSMPYLQAWNLRRRERLSRE